MCSRYETAPNRRTPRSGSFLQSAAASTLRQIAVDNLNLSRYQRDTLTSFLSTSA